MADKITTSKELKLESYYVDGDTRTLTVDNPKDGLTAAQIKAAATAIKNSGALLGDKTGAAFVGFNSPARVVEKTTTQLDLK